MMVNAFSLVAFAVQSQLFPAGPTNINLAFPVPVPRGIGTPRPSVHCRAVWGLREWSEAACPALLPVELPLQWG